MSALQVDHLLVGTVPATADFVRTALRGEPHPDVVDPSEAPKVNGSESFTALATGLAVSRLSVPALWLAYASGGGSLPYGSIADAFAGTLVLDADDHDLLADVLNQESVLSGTGGIVRYSPELDHDGQNPAGDHPEADHPAADAP